MRKNYEKADFDIISLESCDIIRTSLGAETIVAVMIFSKATGIKRGVIS